MCARAHARFILFQHLLRRPPQRREENCIGLSFVFEWMEDRFTTHGRNNRDGGLADYKVRGNKFIMRCVGVGAMGQQAACWHPEVCRVAVELPSATWPTHASLLPLMAL